METKTEVAAVAALALQSAAAQIIPDGERRWLVVGENARVEEVTDPHDLKPKPSRIAQAITVQTVDSLVEYVNAYKKPNTVLFADIAKNRIAAVIDYHGPDDPENTDHVATMDLPFSEEWKAWTSIDGKYLEQLVFARYLEENSADISAPTGAELLEVCRDIQALRKVNFTKVVRTSSENESFEWTDETQATTRNGNLEIPTKFEIEIPVYFDGRTIKFFAFLRWVLIEGAGVKLGAQLHRPEHVRQAIFKELVGKVTDRTGCVTVFGHI